MDKSSTGAQTYKLLKIKQKRFNSHFFYIATPAFYLIYSSVT